MSVFLSNYPHIQSIPVFKIKSKTQENVFMVIKPLFFFKCLCENNHFLLSVRNHVGHGLFQLSPQSFCWQPNSSKSQITSGLFHQWRLRWWSSPGPLLPVLFLRYSRLGGGGWGVLGHRRVLQEHPTEKQRQQQHLWTQHWVLEPDAQRRGPAVCTSYGEKQTKDHSVRKAVEQTSSCGGWRWRGQHLVQLSGACINSSAWVQSW